MGAILDHEDTHTSTPLSSASFPRYLPHSHYGDKHGYRNGERIDTELFISAANNGANVALFEFVHPYRFQNGLGDLFLRKRRVHPVNFRRVEQTIDVRFETERSRPHRRLVTPHPFENRCSVVNDMRANVKFGIVPVDELPIHPDLVTLRYWHLQPSCLFGFPLFFPTVKRF